jgi:serine protease Do
MLHKLFFLALLVSPLWAPPALYSQPDPYGGGTDSHDGEHPFGYLGIGVVPAEDSDRGSLLVRGVFEGSPAAKAGLQRDDVIVKLNGEPVGDVAEFGQQIRQMSPGHKIRLTVMRGKKMLHLTPVLAARPATAQLEPRTKIDLQSQLPVSGEWPTPALRWRCPQIGFEYEGVDSQLADFFGVKQGILVRYVQPESPARNAGLKAGDVLIGVSDRAVNTPRELAMALQAREADRSLLLLIVRDHKQQKLNLAMRGDDGREPRTNSVSTPK